MARKLNDKQKLFILEYLIDLNATQAAIRAGYSVKTAKQQGSLLLTNIDIKDQVEAAKLARQEVVKIDAEWVLRQSVKLHNRCMSDAQAVMEFDPIDKCMVQSEDEHGNKLFKFDSGGAAKGLELVGKHIAIQSFNEKKSITLDLDSATDEELQVELDRLRKDDD